MDYREFLKTKIAVAENFGFEIDPNELNPLLKPHERDIIVWAIKGGKRAIFASFGLGKSIMQIEILRIINKYKKGKCLVVAPLGVRQEFYKDGLMIGQHWEDSAKAKGLDIEQIRKDFGIRFEFVRRPTEMSDSNFYVTNYESVRDGKLDPNLFDVVTLDEASILRGYGTKTYQTFLGLFKNVKFKFVATATPSPNKYKELIHYAGYLGIMDTGQSLTRFFKRDSTKANKLTLYAHKEREFWYWVSSWGVFISKPSDLGYTDEGYELPEIEYIYHELKVDHSSAGADDWGQEKMFRDSAIGLKDASKEKRDSINIRIDKMEDIINESPNDHFLLWHHLESERHIINKKIGSGFEVYGSQDMDLREKRIIDFSNGDMKYLSTKPVIAGSGCNFQRYCHKAIFVGIDYKFNDFIQAVHRVYRFLQTEKVQIHVIFLESEREILKELQRKMAEHYRLVENMIKIIKENGLNNNTSIKQLARTMGIDRNVSEGEHFKVTNNDCVMEAKEIEDNEVGLVLTSIPFSNHYEYTPSYNDFGHTKNNDEFWTQMDFLTPELKRILTPGRVAAIHVKDRILFSSMTEFSFPTVSPFHAECIQHFMKHGFGFIGQITIETDVVRENNQTYRLGWTEQCKDGSKMGVGSPEYLLLFRKQPTSYDDAYSDIPVSKDKSIYTRGMWQIDARAKWNSSGDRFITPDELKNVGLDTINRFFSEYFESKVYNFETHIKTAEQLEDAGRLPATFESLRLKSRNWYLWDDVNRMITLNTSQARKNQNMHICPLQFDIVDRVINRFSNEGEKVFDPFGGLMTVPYRAVKAGRYGMASELNPQYYRDGVAYMKAIEDEISMPSLFDIKEVI